MSKLIVSAVVILVLAAGIWWRFGGRSQPSPSSTAPPQSGGRHMTIQSSAFTDNGAIPVQYTCDGANINPPLTFSGVPQAAKSLALIMEDPDVPKNLKPDGVFDHWVVFNILPGITGIAENEKPSGTEGNNGAGKAQYTGPCPPDREHRYFFKLFALDSMLDLPPGASKAEVEQAMQGHILAQSELVGRYNRQK